MADKKDKKIPEVPHLENVTGVEKIPVSAVGGVPRYVEINQIREGMQPEGDYVTFDDVVSTEKSGIVPKDLAPRLFDNNIASIESFNANANEVNLVYYKFGTASGNKNMNLARIPNASTSNAGAMTTLDKTNLDNLVKNAATKTELSEKATRIPIVIWNDDDEPNTAQDLNITKEMEDRAKNGEIVCGTNIYYINNPDGCRGISGMAAYGSFWTKRLVPDTLGISLEWFCLALNIDGFYDIANAFADNFNSEISRLDGLVENAATKEELATKADDSNVFKKYTFSTNKAGSVNSPTFSENAYDYQSSTGFTFLGNNGIYFNNSNQGVAVSIDTSYIATRTYVDDKINFLVNSEGELEDSFDTLKEVDTWIKEHQDEAADIIRRQNLIEVWKQRTVGSYFAVNNRAFSPTPSSVNLTIDDRLINTGESYTHTYTIPSATATTAGVMSAEDKTALDKLNKDCILYRSIGSGESFLVKLDVPLGVGNGFPVYIKMEGNAYVDKGENTPYNLIIQGWVNQDGSILRVGAYNYGFPTIGNIRFFYYQGYLHLCIDGLTLFHNCRINATSKIAGDIKNLILSVSSGAVMPTTGVTHLVSVTPKQMATESYVDSQLEDAVFGKEVVDETTLPELKTLTREELKKDLFVDLWNERCRRYNYQKNLTAVHGKYNEETGYFELNGLTDITYEEALQIYNVPDVGHGLKGTTTVQDVGSYAYHNVRTVFPIAIMYDHLDYVPWCMDSLEVIRIVDYYTHDLSLDKLDNLDDDTQFNKVRVATSNYFHGNVGSPYDRLKRVLSILSFNGSGEKEHFQGTIFRVLEEMWIYGLKGSILGAFSLNTTFKLECWEYMIKHSMNTAPITITVHADVYAKLTDPNNAEWSKLNQDALAKQITFATA